MKGISEFVVRVFDLIEAEGSALRSAVRDEARRAHRAIAKLAVGLVFLLVAVPLAAGGLALLATGLMWWLETQVTRPLAAAITGGVVLLAGGACVGCFGLLVRTPPP